MRMRIGSGVSIVALLLISIIAFLNIKILKERTGLVNHTNLLLHEPEKVFYTLKDTETGQTGYFLIKNRHCFESNISSCLKLFRAFNKVKCPECFFEFLKDCPSMRDQVCRLNIEKMIEYAKGRIGIKREIGKGADHLHSVYLL